jgi:uncharacterized protein YebE (UPF0316 family)
LLFYFYVFYNYLIIPLLIGLSRIMDVSIGTLRIIFVSRGFRVIASCLGFFEVLIWLLAIRQIMQNLNNPINYIAYATGFALGNFVGISLDRFISLGFLMVRIITGKDSEALVSTLRGRGYGVTTIEADGAEGPVKVIFTAVKRRCLGDVLDTLRKMQPGAFYTVEDVRYAKETKYIDHARTR